MHAGPMHGEANASAPDSTPGPRAAPFGRYAQTILQLHAQAQALGWSDDDRVRTARAYRLAAELLTGQQRGSGKPFTNHLVGTASILAAHGAPRATVLAGLLHAAYEFGDFGDGHPGATAARRDELARVVGDEAERRVHAYWSLRWKDATLAGLLAGAEELDGEARQVVLMRLANELDDHLELGILYCADAEERLDKIARRADRTVSLARRLGWDALADDLEAAYHACRTASVPAGVALTTTSQVQLPRSCVDVSGLAAPCRRRPSST